MTTFKFHHSDKLLIICRVSIIVIVFTILAACSTHDVKHNETTTNENVRDNDNKTNEQFVNRFQSAITDLKQKKYTEAEKLFSDLAKEQPNNDGPYCNLAIIYYKANDYDNALKLINHALDINNNNPQAYNLRAQIMLKKSKVIDAKNDYLKAIEINPKYINAQYNLALLYDIYFQDLKTAIKHYEIYLSLIDVPDERTLEWVNHLKGSLNNG